MRGVPTGVAGEFICDECGRNSYFSWVIIPFDPEELDDVEDDEDDSVSEDMDTVLTEPDRVQCLECRRVYEICNDPDGPHDYPHKLKTTETFRAGEFICLDCNNLNYFSLAKPSNDTLPQDEIQRIMEQTGISDGEVLICPLVVSCSVCKAKYKPEDAQFCVDEDDG